MLLDQIIKEKREEITCAKKRMPITQLEARAKKAYNKIRSLAAALSQGNNYPHLICEMKKASPSEGVLRKRFRPKEIVRQFERGGASAVSVLTDSTYFQGRPEFIQEIRSLTRQPILRKDFLIDRYQVYESRVIGADAILLIASILPPRKLKDLLTLCYDLGMEALVEIHDTRDLRVALRVNAKIIGINNRNLNNLRVNLKHAEALIADVPQNIITVVESGISSKQDIARYQNCHVDGFLVGTALMKAKNIEVKIKELKKGFFHD